MKIKVYFSLLAALVVAALSTTASAYDFSYNDLVYKITNASAKTVMLTYEKYYADGNSNKRYDELIGIVDVPETVRYNNVTYTVTAVDNNALRSCKDFIELRIPATVTSIGTSAFQNCTGVAKIVFKAPSESVQPQPLVIGDNAFNKCQAVTEITLPTWTSSIGNNVFQNCSALTSFSVDEPSQLTTIGDNTFEYSYNVADVYLPNSLTSLGQCSFLNNRALTSIRFPDNMTTISDNICNNCRQLTEIILPKNVTSIGRNAFRGAGSGVYAEKTDIPAGKEMVIELPNKLKTIGIGAFAFIHGLKSITIPGSVQTIGSLAFDNCSNLESVAFEGLVTEADAGESGISFSSAKLKTLIIKGNNFKIEPLQRDFSGRITTAIYDGVTTIAEGSLQGCTAMEKITIPATVKKIENSAFKGCTVLRDFYSLLERPLVIDASVFEDVPVTGYCDLHVPEGSEGRYRAMAVWKDFYAIYEDAGQGGGQLNKFDVNEDGNVNVGDVNAVLDYILEHN